MLKTLRYRLKPEIGLDKDNFQVFIEKKIPPGCKWQLLKRSIDARGKKVAVDVEVGISDATENPWQLNYRKPETHESNGTPVVIVGAGPAGLFAALRCLDFGVRPIILERGKDVQSRRKDLANINKKHIVNPNSNYCFGEGGAGTYSDGKLYTRSKKRGDVRRILEILVTHGASEDILIDTHPHIGTNLLPKVITEIRNTIISRGGNILFDTRVEKFVLKNGEIKGVVTADGDQIEGSGVILATGHSARDIFQLLADEKIKIESKPFALGIRVEHDQELIDSIQYHCDNRGKYLPAAPYTLSTQTILGKIH